MNLLCFVVEKNTIGGMTTHDALPGVLHRGSCEFLFYCNLDNCNLYCVIECAFWAHCLYYEKRKRDGGMLMVSKPPTLQVSQNSFYVTESNIGLYNYMQTTVLQYLMAT